MATTTVFGYTKPAEGDLNWDTTINANLDLIDADLAAQHNADGSHAAVVATSVDVNGGADALILDADGDTTISAPTDDQIDIEINGADDFRFYANTFTALNGSVIATNTIVETTAGAGVSIPDIVLSVMRIPASITINITSGVVEATQSRHAIEVQSGITDDLDTISGGVDGQLLYLNSATGWPIVVKHNTGNLLLAGGTNVTLDSPSDCLTLQYNAALTKWTQVAVADVPSWSTYDVYTTALAAGSVNATSAEPGPGTRTVVDTESKLSIA